MVHACGVFRRRPCAQDERGCVRRRPGRAAVRRRRRHGRPWRRRGGVAARDRSRHGIHPAIGRGHRFLLAVRHRSRRCRSTATGFVPRSISPTATSFVRRRATTTTTAWAPPSSACSSIGSRMSIGHVGDSRLYVIRRRDDRTADAGRFVGRDDPRPGSAARPRRHRPPSDAPRADQRPRRAGAGRHPHDGARPDARRNRCCSAATGCTACMDSEALRDDRAAAPDVARPPVNSSEPRMERGSRDNVTALVVRYDGRSLIANRERQLVRPSRTSPRRCRGSTRTSDVLVVCESPESAPTQTR